MLQTGLVGARPQLHVCDPRHDHHHDGEQRIAHVLHPRPGVLEVAEAVLQDEARLALGAPILEHRSVALVATVDDARPAHAQLCVADLCVGVVRAALHLCHTSEGAEVLVVPILGEEGALPGAVIRLVAGGVDLRRDAASQRAGRPGLRVVLRHWSAGAPAGDADGLRQLHEAQLPMRGVRIEVRIALVTIVEVHSAKVSSTEALA
mmetsp:Transcript_118131/g.341571  ORF Transcript_118131/g.341571 Transcript_118131/m.341571 type:complete len:206 (-) Transcript_118131:206-823(-)